MTLPNLAIPLPSLGKVGQIQAVVADSYGVPREAMKVAGNERTYSWPRQVAMYLARELTPFSYPRIGHMFGGRDHSTVVFAVYAVRKRMKANGLYRADVEALREALS